MRCSLIALMCVLAAPALALAQDEAEPAEPSTENVAARFAEGMAAMEEERLDEALAAFREVYAATGAPSALFNEAWVLRMLTRYVQAEERLGTLLARSDIDERWRRDSEMLLGQVRARIAELRVVGVPPGVVAQLQLDAQQRLAGVERPITVRVDPGAHALVIQVQGFEDFSWSGEAEAGATVEVAAMLRRQAAAGPATGPDANVIAGPSLEEPAQPGSTSASNAALTAAPAPASGSVAESPALWLGVVLGLAAVGVGIGLGFYFQDEAQVRSSACPTGVHCFEPAQL